MHVCCFDAAHDGRIIATVSSVLQSLAAHDNGLPLLASVLSQPHLKLSWLCLNAVVNIPARIYGNA